MSIANGDFDIANFWLNTYKHDLASTIDSMRPERASMCKVHINDLEDELIGAMMLDGVDYYFGEDEAEKERYLRELREG
ncbi:hypothetical protein J4438_00560 [Candidatus Woesearchaeota archaeon]|nr:hypothetical protein [Candidatus Woesearchaeota archaeon]